MSKNIVMSWTSLPLAAKRIDYFSIFMSDLQLNDKQICNHSIILLIFYSKNYWDLSFLIVSLCEYVRGKKYE